MMAPGFSYTVPKVNDKLPCKVSIIVGSHEGLRVAYALSLD